MSLHKLRREWADSLAKNPAKEYAEFKTVYGSTKLGKPENAPARLH